MEFFKGDIEKLTEDNENYRQVLFTGPYSQLVVMTLQPGEDIGEEIHEGHDQFFRIEEGTAKFLIDGEEFEGGDGFAAIVPSGANHNVTNVGEGKLKLYTIYSPAEHPDGTLHKTKAEADEAEH